MRHASARICVFVSTLFVSTNVFAEDTPVAPASSVAPTPSANAPPVNAPPPADVLPEPPPPPPMPTQEEQPAKRPLPKPLPPETPLGPSMLGPSVRLTPMTEPVKRWYGSQTLAVLVPTELILAIGIAADESGTVAAVGSFAFVPIHVLTGPIVHLAHGRVGTAFASLGLNAAIPMASFGIGALVSQVAGRSSTVNPTKISTALGILSAQVIDIVVLSHETIPMPVRRQYGARALLPSSVSIVPRIDPQFRGFALVGQF